MRDKGLKRSPDSANIELLPHVVCKIPDPVTLSVWTEGDSCTQSNHQVKLGKK